MLTFMEDLKRRLVGREPTWLSELDYFGLLYFVQDSGDSTVSNLCENVH